MPNLKDSLSDFYVSSSRYTPAEPKSSQPGLDGYRFLGIAVLLSSIIHGDDKFTNSKDFTDLAKMCNISPKLIRSLTKKKAKEVKDTFMTSMTSEKR